MSATASLQGTAPPVRLFDLPVELLSHAISRLDGPLDIACVAPVSQLCHSSLAELGIRLWAEVRGFELLVQPEGEDYTVQWVCLSALQRESNPPVRLSAGNVHSLFMTARCSSPRAASKVLVSREYLATART